MDTWAFRTFDGNILAKQKSNALQQSFNETAHTLAHLGVHVGDLDPIQPPGDHRGGVGAIGGARHGVGLVCREWLLGTDKVVSERHQALTNERPAQGVWTNQISAYLGPRGVYGDQERKHWNRKKSVATKLHYSYSGARKKCGTK